DTLSTLARLPVHSDTTDNASGTDTITTTVSGTVSAARVLQWLQELVRSPLVRGDSAVPVAYLGGRLDLRLALELVDDLAVDIRFGTHVEHVRGHRHLAAGFGDRKSTRLNSSHVSISYAVFCLKKKYI